MPTTKTQSNEDLAQKYQKKTDKEHILDNPDTYIGSVEHLESELHTFQDDSIKSTTMTYIPGLYKLFDEAIVNARDHAIRTQQWIDEGKENTVPLSYISVNVDNDGTITIINDGNGIDVEKHPTY